VSGLGLRSTAFLGTTAVSVTVPTAPQSFTATAVSGGTSVNLSWAAPSSNGGAAITGYTLKNGATTVYTGTGTSITQTGLTPATAYSYTVLATNSVGDGPTASASATTSAGVPSVPTLTYSYSSTEAVYDETGDYLIGYANFYFFYTPYTSNNGSSITSTTLQFSYDSGANWNTGPVVAYPNGNQIYYGQFVGNGTYLYRSFHTNAVGNSPVSNSVTITT